MPWFHFEKRFDFFPLAPSQKVMLGYLPGMDLLVTTKVAEAAEAAKAGYRIKKPGGDEEPADGG